DQGGLEILDLQAHNKAIEAMWIKELLSNKKPTWTFYAHNIIAQANLSSEKNIDQSIKMNIFLQSFNAKKSILPPDLCRILSLAKETGVWAEGIIFSREILHSRPIWYHSEADPKIRSLTRSSASICLRDKHNLWLVGEVEEISQLLDDPNHNCELWNARCECHICTAMRENLGCKKPNNCMLRVKELLDTLPNKWDPRFMLPEDYKEGPEPMDESFKFDR
ncbi:hypothetical protein EV421DRAFT_1716206, partial [Armillaria borealis]